MSSPAERFAAARARTAWESTAAGRFAGSLGFALDDFQLTAIKAVQEGHGVLVAAPTGAGKTVVGEFAVALGLETGHKTFYTTPIKALSNQKYHDLVARHGAANVGLLTGDASINGEAPVVVMTTEVLRNMMYSSSPTLTGLGFVVMDEVHYLADRWRGAVWEEVIIHLPPSVQVISLSATVSNAEEFGDWLTTVRGGETGLQTQVIVSEHRPVPLWQHMMVGQQLFDLFVTDGSGGGTADVGGTTRVNPELLQRITSAERAAQSGGWRRADEGGPRGRRGEPRGSQRGGGRDGGSGRSGGGRGRGGRDSREVGRGGRSDRTRGYSDARGYRGDDGAVPAGGALPGGVASRTQVIERLEREGLLPAITFIFSRAGCDAAVQQLLGRGMRLIPDQESVAVRDLVTRRVEAAAVDPRDLGVLGYHDFVEGLSRGYAAHHAGMLPLFREIVEELFTAGRVRAVFATETLALGINMPARTVVLEKLVKFNGETHAPVTPAEYTQLTGRAGRRGIDIEGHAVVLWRRGMDPMDVAGLASTRTYPLRSSFRPSSNMAVNLVAQYGRERAHELLQSSFAQFQADRSVVGLTTQVRDNSTALEGYAEAMACDRGDFREYGRLRHELSELEKKQARRRQAERRSDIAQALEELEPGQVIQLDGGRKGSMAVVLRSPKGRSAAPELSVITSNGSLQRLGVAGFRDVPEVIGTLRIPGHFNPRSPKARKDLASALRSSVHEHPFPGPSDRTRATAPQDTREGSSGHGRSNTTAQVEELRARLKAHPCHSCPDREDHARWAARWWQLRKETDDLQRRVAHRTNAVAKTFERICDLLAGLGYLTEDGQQVTPQGGRLRRIYTELDLVVAESIRRGAWDRLTPADLASVVSAIIHEARGDETAEPPVPSVEVAEALGEMAAIWREVQDAKREHDLTGDRELDTGITWMVHRWASGRGLDEVLRGGDLSAGDFVRRAKQVIDLLGQIAQAADGDLARTARKASDAVLRGVVAADRLD
ncbi:DEAD/DEAH box helicase [Ornithinimicrobium pratense]|uniref:DEAD/DEAH box helicase n=1 Tax=Ornithinimicrobium pratense TaxID=2593973 RepID=A0A5J6V6J3_9MICO|nr:DEAD/DEAH box helicase [Ornithinimicrobium pratense]QFG68652.1 DEAD/DEAH box helicase [Ornithinimicrobium pratense]